METIEGSIERVRYYNETNGYTIASFYLPFKEKQKIKDVTFIGNSLTIVGTFDRKVIEDEEYILTGEFIKDKKYGFQFKFSSFERKQFDSKIGLINFLSSDLFPGVGLAASKKVVEALGLNALKKIKEDNKVLNDVDITPKQKETIINVLLKDKGNEEALIFLLNNGISIVMARKIIDALSNTNVIETVSKNPYLLIDKVERFGFKRADLLANSLGIPKDNPKRLEALIRYALDEIIYSNGNSYVYIDDLHNYVCRKLDEIINYDDYRKMLDKLVTNNKIYVDSLDRVFSYDLYQDEVTLGDIISELVSKDQEKRYGDNAIKKALDTIIKEADFTYNDEQLKAISSAFKNRIMIITGGPGTGKTTIIHAVIKMYMLLNKNNVHLIDKIALLAPTGRAAKRLNETTNMPASTIHKYLGYNGDGLFEYGAYNKTDSRLIIVDEASMMDTQLAARLFSAADSEAHFIIVGDVDQLPSVGPGQVLQDLIDTNLIDTIRLTKIHRQAEGSSIVKLAHDVNDGYLPENLLEKMHDRNFIVTDDETLPKLVTDLFVKAIKKGKKLQDIQILIPMYKGNTGINEINHLIQDSVNPHTENNDEININGKKLRVGDKVIQLINRADKGVMNGDIGYITSINLEDNKLDKLVVAFDTVKVEYETEDISELTLAYAISIHKAQGSEFDLVIMPLTNAYSVMLKKKLLYTGITRAKNTLILIGNPQALNYGITRLEKKRDTILKDLIINVKDVPNIKDELKRLEKENKNDIEDINLLGEEEIEL